MSWSGSRRLRSASCAGGTGRVEHDFLLQPFVVSEHLQLFSVQKASRCSTTQECVSEGASERRDARSRAGGEKPGPQKPASWRSLKVLEVLATRLESSRSLRLSCCDEYALQSSCRSLTLACGIHRIGPTSRVKHARTGRLRRMSLPARVAAEEREIRDVLGQSMVTCRSLCSSVDGRAGAQEMGLIGG